MGKFILEDSEVHYILNNLRSIYEGLINTPLVGLSAPSKATAHISAEDDLEVANVLLAALEKVFPLHTDSRGADPKAYGFATASMLEDYNRMKHWQQMLNLLYGHQAELPQQRSKEGPCS